MDCRQCSFSSGTVKWGVVTVEKLSKELQGSCLMSQVYQGPGTNTWRQKPWSGLVMERKALLPRAESSQGQGQHFHWGFEALFFRVFSGAGIRSKISFCYISFCLTRTLLGRTLQLGKHVCAQDVFGTLLTKVHVCACVYITTPVA